MPLPTVRDLDDAYEQGRTAAPDARNPYFPCTPMAIQWEYGQRDNAPRNSVPRPILTLTRIVMAICVSTIIVALTRIALL